MSNASASLQPGRSRTQLWVLIVLFFAPLAISFLLYYGLDGWRPEGSTNSGDLMEPARSLPEAVLPAADGTETAPDFLRGKWSLVFVGDGSCDERCRAALTDIRQVRIALNQDSTRVQRVFLHTGACCDRDYFGREHPGLIVAGIDTPAGEALLQAFPAYDAVAPLAAGRLYIVDPIGNLMMSYAPDAPARGLLDDLKKLLKLSQIG